MNTTLCISVIILISVFYLENEEELHLFCDKYAENEENEAIDKRKKTHKWQELQDENGTDSNEELVSNQGKKKKRKESKKNDQSTPATKKPKKEYAPCGK